MTIKEVNCHYVIQSGNGHAYFSFFVNHDKASWTKRLFGAQSFSSREEAEETIKELKRRRAKLAQSKRENIK